MRFVKLTLSGLIVVSLSIMWSSRHPVLDAYDTTPNTLELRLSGVDLAVARTERSRSPYATPAAPDTRNRPLPVRSTTELAPPVALVATSGGKGKISGTVVGPDGPQQGALVRIERHTSDGIGVLQMATDLDGRWSFEELPGGRYRARAWVPGLMTTGRSEVTFLPDEGSAEFAFSLWGVDPAPSFEFVDGGQIYQGGTGTVAVVVTRRSVDLDGVVVTVPVPSAAVSIELSPTMSLVSSPVQFTDPQGSARFVLGCPAQGLSDTDSNGVLVARFGELVGTFPLPGCQPVPPPDPDSEPASDPTADPTSDQNSDPAGGAAGA